MKCTHENSYLNLDLICVKINHNWCNFNSCWLRGTKLCLSHDLGSHSICSLVAHPLVFLYNKKKGRKSLQWVLKQLHHNLLALLCRHCVAMKYKQSGPRY